LPKTPPDGKSGVLLLDAKRIEQMRRRLEDQSLELSRLALGVERRHISAGEISKTLLLTVRSLDLEMRELEGIQCGRLQ
jgi:hypothetical protein